MDKHHIHAEISGTNQRSGLTYHSDICWDGEIVSPRTAHLWMEWRKFLHDNLDEFLDNFNFGLNNEGEGQYFFVGYPPKED